jgi:carboxyl-terminal processing protease
MGMADLRQAGRGLEFNRMAGRLAGRMPAAVRVVAFTLGLSLLAAAAGRAEQPPTALAANAVQQTAAKPGPNDRQITLAVRSYLEREHFTRRPIDDEIARRWFGIFIESLDPMKNYFLQSDIDAFTQKRDSLDDLVKRGDVSFAYEVYNRFLERVDARLPLIEKLINMPHDFTKPESIIVDRDDTVWAANEAEAAAALIWVWLLRLMERP